MNCKKFFALMACLLLCSFIDVWAASDNDSLLVKVATEYADIRGLFKNIAVSMSLFSNLPVITTNCSG